MSSLTSMKTQLKTEAQKESFHENVESAKYLFIEITFQLKTNDHSL